MGYDITYIHLKYNILPFHTQDDRATRPQPITKECKKLNLIDGMATHNQLTAHKLCTTITINFERISTYLFRVHRFKSSYDTNKISTGGVWRAPISSLQINPVIILIHSSRQFSTVHADAPTIPNVMWAVEGNFPMLVTG